MSNCPLCEIPEKELYRVVRKNDLTYAAIPIPPITEGHVIVLPRRHATLKELTPAELWDLNENIEDLKNRLVQLYPGRHPIIATMSDTMHASIPDHSHYHLIPSELNLRTVYARCYQLEQKWEPEDLSWLEKLATLLRG